MPFMTNGKRDYKKENRLYNSKPEQIKARGERTTLRRQANVAGVTKKGDGKDLDHIKPLSKGGANTMANARVVTQKANRSFARNSNGSLKNQTSKAERHKQ